MKKIRKKWGIGCEKDRFECLKIKTSVATEIAPTETSGLKMLTLEGLIKKRING